MAVIHRLFFIALLCFLPEIYADTPDPPEKKFQPTFWVSYLHWKPNQDFMDVALAAIPGNINIQPFAISWEKGYFVTMPSRTVSGVKVGGSLESCECRWDLSAEFTFLDAKNSISAVNPSGGWLFARWIQPNVVLDNRATSVHASWTLAFRNLNFEVGRMIETDPGFILKPKVGIALAGISQKYKGEIFLTDPFVPGVLNIDLAVKSQSSSFGMGPRMGLSGRWCLRSICDLSASIAGDLLLTDYHLKLDQEALNQSSIFVKSRDKVIVVQPEIEMYLGIGFQFRCFRLDVGYDEQIWFFQNMIRWYSDTFYVATPRGNLSFRGLRTTLTRIY